MLNLFKFCNLCEMSPFRFESSCAWDGGMWWIILHRARPYLVVLSSGCGEFFYSHTATRASSWPYMDFWTSFEHSNFFWRQFWGGVMPLYGKWVCLWPYIGMPQVFGVHKKPHTLLLSIFILHFFHKQDVLDTTLCKKVCQGSPPITLNTMI